VARIKVSAESAIDLFLVGQPRQSQQRLAYIAQLVEVGGKQFANPSTAGIGFTFSKFIDIHRNLQRNGGK
jgi:hypothetical protein